MMQIILFNIINLVLKDDLPNHIIFYQPLEEKKHCSF